MALFKIRCCLLLLIVLSSLVTTGNSWRRRRRRGCSAVNCLVGNWNSWGSCSAACGTTGIQTRYRSKTRTESCGGSCTFTFSNTRSCNGPCCRKDCIMNMWGSWSSCSGCGSSCTQYRYRSISRYPSCGGSSCPSSTKTQRNCTPCPCCPVNCIVNSWGTWLSCNAPCGGSGVKWRYRTISRFLEQLERLFIYLREWLTVSSWSAYSSCTNTCGLGTQTRTRTITTSPLCGRTCPALSQTTSCTVYANKNCQVDGWSSWSSCSMKCSTGLQQRNRTITQQQVCKGNSCPSLVDTKSCGSPNGGCQHNCNDGVCSCNTGYLLGSDGTSCNPRVCGTPSIAHCPSGTTYGTTCRYPTFSCTGTTYLHTCSITCPSGYAVKNAPSAMKCLSSGVWTTYSTTYCRRINDPPTKVSLSNSVVNENAASGTVVGTLSTTDPNVGDSHTYALLDSAGAKFTLTDTSLKIAFSPNYETQQRTYVVEVRSTDKKGLYHNEKFTISITDVNEKPTNIQISNNDVNENSPVETVVGKLNTNDPDNSQSSRQSFKYALLDTAGGRFKVVGDTIKVAVDNTNCIAFGGLSCLLNYEAQRQHDIVVRATDSGVPSLSVDIKLSIFVNDINDQPRDLDLSDNKVVENYPIDTVIGILSSTDEDDGQRLSYSLADDDNGRFKVVANELKVAKVVNYEMATAHSIVVESQDNGTTPLKVYLK
ncbi:coadhesin-like [Corticium candelabrum]|uniref:coadhesin-like n=1 Tax=Corticium candelabrum TaxID=121492 RepID=UPI002E263673|nr:coadhesin-like [Corticium candelabrum]